MVAAVIGTRATSGLVVAQDCTTVLATAAATVGAILIVYHGIAKRRRAVSLDASTAVPCVRTRVAGNATEAHHFSTDVTTKDRVVLNRIGVPPEQLTRPTARDAFLRKQARCSTG